MKWLEFIAYASYWFMWGFITRPLFNTLVRIGVKIHDNAKKAKVKE